MALQSLVWKKTWLVRTEPWSHLTLLGWTGTQTEMGLITSHQWSLMLLLLNGSKYLQPDSNTLYKAFPEEWRHLHQQINAHCFVINWSKIPYGCNVQMSIYFWPYGFQLPDALWWYQPWYVVIITEHSIGETYDTHEGCEEQHLCVEAQPGKVDPNLFPVVLPTTTESNTHTHTHWTQNIHPWKECRIPCDKTKDDRCRLVTWWGWEVALCKSREIWPSSCTSCSAHSHTRHFSPFSSIDSERRENDAARPGEWNFFGNDQVFSAWKWISVFLKFNLMKNYSFNV